MDEKNLDRIDRYLRKEMSPEESLNFEQEALNDSELLEEVDLSCRVKRSLADRQQKLYVTSKWANRQRNRIIQFSSIISVAAMVLIGLFIWLPLKDAQKDEPLLAVVNGTTDESIQIESNQIVRSVKKSIEDGEEEKAIEKVEQLEQMRVIPTLDVVSARGFGTSNLLSNERNDSLALYKDAYELHWLKICALVKMGNKKEAKEKLASFILIEGKYKQKADSLLQALNK